MSSPKAAAKQGEGDSPTASEVDEGDYFLLPGVSLYAKRGYDHFPKQCGYCGKLRPISAFKRVPQKDPPCRSGKCDACVKAKNTKRLPGLDYIKHYTHDRPSVMLIPTGAVPTPTTQEEIDTVKAATRLRREKQVLQEINQQTEAFETQRQEIVFLRQKLAALDADLTARPTTSAAPLPSTGFVSPGVAPSFPFPATAFATAVTPNPFGTLSSR